jgi:hypothetical protein
MFPMDDAGALEELLQEHSLYVSIFLSWGFTTERVLRGIFFKSAIDKTRGWEPHRRSEVLA